MIFDHITMNILQDYAQELLMNSVADAQYNNLTGNTVTSYTVGLYQGNILTSTINVVQLGLDPPTFKKARVGDGYFMNYDTGEIVHYVQPYNNGDEFAETDDDYGYITALKFLQSYKPNMKGIFLVVTTGTEYSEFLERVRGLNVLTDTYLYAGGILRAFIKPINNQ